MNESILITGANAGLGKETVRAFEGMEVTIWLTATDHYPQAILMSARFSDGSVSALLGDGSVQQLSRQNYDEYLKQSGQPEH